MHVSIKELSAEIVLKNKGMELEIRTNNNRRLGDLIIKKAGIEWCRGQIPTGAGLRIKWEELIAYFEEYKKV